MGSQKFRDSRYSGEVSFVNKLSLKLIFFRQLLRLKRAPSPSPMIQPNWLFVSVAKLQTWTKKRTLPPRTPWNKIKERPWLSTMPSKLKAFRENWNNSKPNWFKSNRRHNWTSTPPTQHDGSKQNLNRICSVLNLVVI